MVGRNRAVGKDGQVTMQWQMKGQFPWVHLIFIEMQRLHPVLDGLNNVLDDSDALLRRVLDDRALDRSRVRRAVRTYLHQCSDG